MAGLETKEVLRSADGITSPISYHLDDRGRVNVSLSMSPEAFTMLSELAAGGTLEEVISKAFVLYKIAADARREGKSVGIASTADALDTEIVGF